MTNPFYVGITYPESSCPGTPLGKLLVNREHYFTIEASSGSAGTEETRRISADEWMTVFSYNLAPDPAQNDFWSALTSRRSYDFSGRRGFVFQCRSEEESRFWIEYRTRTQEGDIWYRHSFLAESEWKSITVPFNRFQVISGPVKKPDLSSIYAIFISINNAIAYPETRGTLFLKNMGLY
jgi:hypothetical protein